MYGRLSGRGRPWIDILGTVFFLFPWLAILAVTSAPFVLSSWSIREASATADGMPGLYLLKSLLWGLCALLFVQGLALIARRSLYLAGHGIVDHDEDKVTDERLEAQRRHGSAMSTVLIGEVLAVAMFATTIGAVLLGYPVAFTLAGVGLIFATLGIVLGVFDVAILSALVGRYFGTMTNETLVAVPLFVFMGVMLERSKIAEALLTTMGGLFGALRGGLGYSVVVGRAVLAGIDSRPPYPLRFGTVAINPGGLGAGPQGLWRRYPIQISTWIGTPR